MFLEKLKDTGAGMKIIRRNLLRLLAVYSGVFRSSATSKTGVRWDDAGYTARDIILQN
jgi:hypothetical protein